MAITNCCPPFIFYGFIHVAQIDQVTLFANVLPSIFYHTIMTMYLMIPNFSNLTLIEIVKLLFYEFNNFKGTLRVSTHDNQMLQSIIYSSEV